MQKMQDKLLTPALTLLRVGIGVVMTAHGWVKLTNVGQWKENFGSMGIPAPDIAVWFAIAGEFLGGLGLIVGLLTPIAALGVAFTMLTAIFSVHISNGLFAKNGGFEYPLIVLLSALFFFARGAGPMSLDAARASRKTG